MSGETREQAIRRVWNSAPRAIGKWEPITVSMGDRKNDMLALQRKTRSDGKGGSPIVMRVIRKGRIMNGGPVETLLYTFRLTGDNVVKQDGVARKPSDEELAEWRAAGFTVPGESPAPTPAPPAERVEEARGEPEAARQEIGRKSAGNRQVDKFYSGLLGKKSTSQLASSGGRTLYSVEVSVNDRIAHQVNGRFPETDAFSLRAKSDVTGDPLARGWILVRKQASTSANTSANLAPVASEQRSAPADTAAKLQARQDRKARTERDEPTIELRKRLSVLRSLKECLG